MYINFTKKNFFFDSLGSLLISKLDLLMILIFDANLKKYIHLNQQIKKLKKKKKKISTTSKYFFHINAYFTLARYSQTVYQFL